MDTILSGKLNDDLLTLVNQKATQLKKKRLALCDQMDELKCRDNETDVVVDLAKSWRTADYERKRQVAMIMIEKIVISEDGSVRIVWNS